MGFVTPKGRGSAELLEDQLAHATRVGLSSHVLHDSTEKAALTADVSTYGCANSTITVTLAR